jgi:hypothetical protein
MSNLEAVMVILIGGGFIVGLSWLILTYAPKG